MMDHLRSQTYCRWLQCLLLLFLLWLAGCGVDREALLSQAQADLTAEKFEAARRAYALLLDCDPFDLAALRGMVNVSVQSETREEQVQWCRRLLALDPWDRQANLLVGKALEREGNLKDAAVRYILAYQSSDFQNEKKEVLGLLTALSALELKESKAHVVRPATPE
jgi:predicted Zn-dependent protease